MKTCIVAITVLATFGVISCVPTYPFISPLKKGSTACGVLYQDGGVCSEGKTSCSLSDGRHGCCPLPNAVCCGDKAHCCPQGFTCDDDGNCMRVNTPGPLKKKQLPILYGGTKSVRCHDKKSECPNRNTCCFIANSKEYGCCPLHDAVCCTDGKHCCPSGYTCNEADGTCSKSGSRIPMLKKASPVGFIGNVPCPDGSECPKNNTCCLAQSGKYYGCCPLPNAVCCSDGKHCCPNDYYCNEADGTCTDSLSVIPMIMKVSAVDSVSNVYCPDGSSECPDDNTCCLTQLGKYGCCPLANAVCCSDGKHCCPQGKACDDEHGKCMNKETVLPIVEKAFSSNRVVENVICPNNKNECPNDNTCCLTTSGEYGCCDEPDAVCCSDGKHCCPKGHTCDLQDGICKIEGSMVPLLESVGTLKAVKGAAVRMTSPISVTNSVCAVLCPDHKIACSNKCCYSNSHKVYMCCEFSNGVCCQDADYCCPNGYTCKINGSKANCEKVSIPTSWLQYVQRNGQL